MHTNSRFYLRWLFMTLLLWTPATVVAQDSTERPGQVDNDQPLAQTLNELITRAASENKIPVIVGIRTPFQPEGNLSESDVQNQRQNIATRQGALLNDLAAFDVSSIKRFQTIPYVAMQADAETLQLLSTHPDVVSIEEDVAVPPTLAESTALIGADDAWAMGYSGEGQAVAILDTGVDSGHSFLSGKVVSEACFSSTNVGLSSTVCPNGLDAQTGTGAGINCSLSVSGCNHGTHVAGIAAGDGPSFSGVAKDGDIIAIQVFSRFDSQANCGTSPAPCVLSFTSDQILGLEHVFLLSATLDIASANMSLGGGMNTTTCDGDSRKTIIDNLRSADIATVIASGNNGFTNALSAPACISTSVSVGSTDDGSLGTTVDIVSSFSNSASFLKLLAPGRWINSSVPGDGFSNFSGTSMAAPHVAGAWAVLKSQNPSATVDDVLDALTGSGVLITDARNGIMTSRIQLDAALSPLTRFVATTGSDTSNNCLNDAAPCATVTHAVDEAAPNDIINIEAGTYLEPGLMIEKAVHIVGADVVVH